MWRRHAQGDRSDEVLRVVQNRKAKKTKALLEASESELLKIAKVNVLLPPEARIYWSVACALCAEKVAEPRARIKEGQIVCIPCFEAGQSK
jgi:formylmethanofuran dehydrogenase subunit E